MSNPACARMTPAMATAERSARKLRDVLFEYGILSEDALQGMSHQWECELVPEVDDDATIREHVLHEEPCLCSPELAEGVHGRTGKDGLAFLSQWDGFPKPKICMRSGWGGPGTQATGDDHVALVRGFREVLDSDDALNLQLFHRPGDESDPGLPVLSESLTWPVPEVLETVDRGGSSFVVDNATRVSKKGAVTWWHMDDCGEFTFQVGLRKREGAGEVVKAFIFAPKGCYDIISQDKITNKLGSFAQIDPFTLQDNALPPGPPRLKVALLRSGGRPLLSPPNLPHLVITASDCAMVEQRRVSALFYDESWLFFERAKPWKHRPIVYTLFTNTLTDARSIEEHVLPILRSFHQSHDSLLRARASASAEALLQGGLVNVGSVEMGDIEDELKAIAASNSKDHLFSRNTSLAERARQSEVAYGVARCPTEEGGFIAYIHVNGRPNFGPSRADGAKAKADRKVLKNAALSGSLSEKLSELRSNS